MQAPAVLDKKTSKADLACLDLDLDLDLALVSAPTHRLDVDVTLIDSIAWYCPTQSQTHLLVGMHMMDNHRERRRTHSRI